MSDKVKKPAWDNRARLESIDGIGTDAMDALTHRLTSSVARTSRYEFETMLTELILFLAATGSYPRIRKKLIEQLGERINKGMRQSTVNLLGSIIDDLDLLMDDSSLYLKDPVLLQEKYKIHLKSKEH